MLAVTPFGAHVPGRQYMYDKSIVYGSDLGAEPPVGADPAAVKQALVITGAVSLVVGVLVGRWTKR